VLDAVGILANSNKYLDAGNVSVGSTHFEISSFIKDDEGKFETKISSIKTEDGEALLNLSDDLHIDNNHRSEITKRNHKIIYYESNRTVKNLAPAGYAHNPFFVSDFKHFIDWYINEENNENREIVRNGNGYQNPRLTPMREALERFFSNLRGSSKYENLYVETLKENSNSYHPYLFIKKNKEIFKLDNLSDGEKMAVLVVGDIARKLTVNYKGNKPEEILKESAIILMDEVDLHLHPGWQRDIIPALAHVFPNVQFLVTTHSPQVLSNVRKESVHIIKDFKRVPFTPSIYGADSNMILWDVFGEKKRPEHADEKFSEFYTALEREDRDTVLKLLKKLQQHFSEDRLDVQKAKTAFEFEYDEYLPEA